jgi:hypothetical protein
MVTTQRIALFRSFFCEAGSALAKTHNSLKNFIKIDGNRQDKSYGLGRVGFPRTKPAVTVQAVSL